MHTTYRAEHPKAYEILTANATESAFDQVFRFSDYDLFGFLASGLAVLAACDLITGTTFLFGASWSASEATLGSGLITRR